MPYKYLIIDGQNLYWRTVLGVFKNIYSLEEESEGEVNSIVIKEAFKRLENLKARFGYEDSLIYLLFDNPSSKINKRKLIYKEYKHARDKKVIPPVFYRILEVFQTLLQYAYNNCFLIMVEDLEADDLAKPLIDSLTFNEEDRGLVISADLDWARNITKNIDWFNYVAIYNEFSFKEEHGFSPIGKKIQLYKAFHGDNSDNIPNAVPYLPKEVLLYLVNKFDTLEDLLSNLWTIQECPQTWKLKIKDAESQLVINYTLADFLDTPEKIEKDIVVCQENVKVLRYLYQLAGIPLDTKVFDPDSDNFFQSIN